ncbi:DUF3419 family protein [Parvibaculum sp.]|uniref:DUF3419 family protein n=1 Tax=Parvibaculum sp. TaxID=2024848 RepID=UPI00391B81F3
MPPAILIERSSALPDSYAEATTETLRPAARHDVKKRLGEAVHRHKPVSRAGLTERLFTWLFTGLVYPQIWEDPEVDIEAMALSPDMNPDTRVVAIASGGCNALSYVTAAPVRVTAIDLNPAHVALVRLKREGARSLPSHDHFYRFFGEADARENLADYRRFLRPKLDETTRAYWDKRPMGLRRRISLFARGFYRHGLLGYFIGWAHLAARLYGVSFRELLEAPTLDSQRRFFDQKLAPLFERKTIKWLTTRHSTLYGLGIPPAQYEALAGGREMRVVLRERLERLTCAFPLSENYFAWQAFARQYAPGGKGPLPPYLKRENFAALQAHAGNVEVLNASYTDHLREAPEANFDRYVLLDAQDWMTDAQLNDLWSQITRTARKGARVIFRTAAEPTLLPGRVDDAILARWDYRAEESLAFTARDRSSIYGGFHLYVLKD